MCDFPEKECTCDEEPERSVCRYPVTACQCDIEPDLPRLHGEVGTPDFAEESD